MLTEDEWREVAPLLKLDIERIKGSREQQGGLRGSMDVLQFEACEKYFEITGFRETNPNAIWHHRLSDYGSECPDCGHLLRTPRASFCANCGALPFRKKTDGEIGSGQPAACPEFKSESDGKPQPEAEGGSR